MTTTTPSFSIALTGWAVSHRWVELEVTVSFVTTLIPSPPRLTVASCPSRGFSQDLTPSRVRLTPTRPSFPRRLISWSGLTTRLWNEEGWILE